MIEQAQVAADILKEMKELAAKIRLLVNGMPPEETPRVHLCPTVDDE
ncbi:hypothetical protein AB8849_01195 [Proteus vulgaris]